MNATPDPAMIAPLAITADPPPDLSDEMPGLLAVREGGLCLLGTTADTAPADAEAFLEAVAAIARAAPCVPMRAAQALVDAASARRLLRAGAERFDLLLRRFAGRDEWAVTIEPAATPAPVLTPAETALPPGHAYLERRREAHAEADGVPRALARVASRLARALAPLVVESRTLPSPHGATLALLVDRADGDALEVVFGRASAGEPHACTLTGPWPAFSFTSLDASVIRAA